MALSATSWDEVRSYVRDDRFAAMLVGLDQLPNSALARLNAEIAKPAHLSMLLTDGGNYDAVRNHWCALAVALEVPATARSCHARLLSNRDGRALLIETGRTSVEAFTTNPVSGVPGRAYTTQRLRDLKLAVTGLLNFRSSYGLSRATNWTGAHTEAALACALGYS